MSERIKRVLLVAEFAILFFGIPLIMYLVKRFPLPSIFLIPVLIFVFFILRYRTDFKWKELVYLRITRKQLIRDGIILSASAVSLLVLVLTLMPGKFLNLPRANPWIWLALGAFYPVFSAYPQEILYRTFIFRRYTKIFPGKWPMIAASGVSFSFVHILYYHPISMLLTLIGGIYLASTYNRTRSVLYTAILHGVLGMLVFTVGLGEYFWLEMYDFI
jgi:membrane protease YdiL (CAAX protease family)